MVLPTTFNAVLCVCVLIDEDIEKGITNKNTSPIPRSDLIIHHCCIFFVNYILIKIILYPQGTLTAIRDWFRDYKIPDGKPANKFGLGNKPADKVYSMSLTYFAPILTPNRTNNFCAEALKCHGPACTVYQQFASPKIFLSLCLSCLPITSMLSSSAKCYVESAL